MFYLRGYFSTSCVRAMSKKSPLVSTNSKHRIRGLFFHFTILQQHKTSETGIVQCNTRSYSARSRWLPSAHSFVVLMSLAVGSQNLQNFQFGWLLGLLELLPPCRLTSLGRRSLKRYNEKEHDGNCNFPSACTLCRPYFLAEVNLWVVNVLSPAKESTHEECNRDYPDESDNNHLGFGDGAIVRQR